jgi:hypothetical protein
MRRIIIPAVASLALIASGGLAEAQGRPDREGPPGSGEMRAPDQGQKRAPDQGKRPNREIDRSPATRPDASRPARVERPDRPVEPNRRAEPQPRREREGTIERPRRATEQDRTRAEQQREEKAERARSTERQRDRDQKRFEDKPRPSAEQPSIRRDSQRTERTDRDERVTQRHAELQQARARLSAEQRQRLHAAFDRRQARVSNVRFDFRIGHRVPRHLRLFPIPLEVITFTPHFRGYSYFVVDETICIVDPRTYVVVDVIDEGYWTGRPEVASLVLTPAQIAFIRDSVPADFPEANVRLRLALGAEIPPEVELYEFPVIVLDEVKQLRNYRFLVTIDQIVIADPRDRSIALVIERV